MDYITCIPEDIHLYGTFEYLTPVDKLNYITALNHRVLYEEMYLRCEEEIGDAANKIIRFFSAILGYSNNTELQIQYTTTNHTFELWRMAKTVGINTLYRLLISKHHEILFHKSI